MNAGTFKGRITDWGLKFYTEKNEYKIYVKFELDGEIHTRESITWHGSIDDTPRTSKAGKTYTMLDITKSNLKTLGYKYGEDLEAIVAQPDPFDMDQVFYVDVAQFTGNDGRTGTYVKSFDPVNKETGTRAEKVSANVKILEKPEAQSVLAALSRKTGTGLKKASGSSLVDDIGF